MQHSEGLMSYVTSLQLEMGSFRLGRGGILHLIFCTWQVMNGVTNSLTPICIYKWPEIHGIHWGFFTPASEFLVCYPYL